MESTDVKFGEEVLTYTGKEFHTTSIEAKSMLEKYGIGKVNFFYEKGAKKSQLHDICRLLPCVNSN